MKVKIRIENNKLTLIINGTESIVWVVPINTSALMVTTEKELAYFPDVGIYLLKKD